MNDFFKHRLMLTRNLVGFFLLTVLVVACVSKAGDLGSKNKTKTEAPAISATPVDGSIIQQHKS